MWDSPVCGKEREMQNLPEHIGSAVDRFQNRIAKVADGSWPDGLRTGLTDLDDILGGFQPGTLNILAGRPAMGCTTLALNIARHVAVEKNETTLYIGMREEPDFLAQRMICILAGVDSHRLRKSRLTEKEEARVREAAARLKESPLYLCDGCGLTFGEIEDEIFGLHDRHPDADSAKQPKLAVIDSLDELSIRSDAAVDLPEDVPEESREVAHIIEALRRTAEYQGIAVLLITGLDRAIERRPGHRPRARDLPHFHYVMRHADTVLLLHRRSYYNAGKEEGTAELLITRNRFGPTGGVTLAFDRASMRFSDVCGEREQPGHAGGPGSTVVSRDPVRR